METWMSQRKKRELETAARAKYFDAFIDLVLDNTMEFNDAIQAYKETLEGQNVPLGPQTKTVYPVSA